MADKNKNISFTCSKEQLFIFLKKIKDLTNIDKRIIIRMENDNVLIFSFVGDSFKNVHAFKNYVFPIETIFNIKKGAIDSPIFLIVKDGKRFYKTVENLLDYQDDIKCKISVNDENYVNFISFNNSKLDIKIIGSDPITIGAQISIEDVEFLMDIERSIFNFKINKLDFSKIKKMSLIDRIENDNKSPIYININDKILSIGETKWRLYISDIEYRDITISFPKVYFNTMDPSDVIDVYVFEEFILCKFDDYNLMILLETSV